MNIDIERGPLILVVVELGWALSFELCMPLLAQYLSLSFFACFAIFGTSSQATGWSKISTGTPVRSDTINGIFLCPRAIVLSNRAYVYKTRLSFSYITIRHSSKPYENWWYKNHLPQPWYPLPCSAAGLIFLRNSEWWKSTGCNWAVHECVGCFMCTRWAFAGSYTCFGNFMMSRAELELMIA